MNILFTSAGRRGYLIQYFKKALDGRGLVHVGNSEPASAFIEADRSVITPLIYSDEYIEFLLDYCQEHDIRAIIPLFDMDVPVLARSADRFAAEGVVLIASSENVARICNDKWASYHFLREHGIATPSTFLNPAEAREAVREGQLDYPVVVKPRWGCGALGVYLADDETELEVLYRKTQREIDRSYLRYESAAAPERSVVIQELLVGVQYLLDVVNDLNGNFITTAVKKQLDRWGGEANAALVVDEPLMQEVGRKLGRALGHRANLDVDAFLCGDVAYIVEMNARFGGGYPFSHLAGLDLPKAVLSWIQDQPADPECFEIVTGVLGLKTIEPVTWSELGGRNTIAMDLT